MNLNEFLEPEKIAILHSITGDINSLNNLIEEANNSKDLPELLFYLRKIQDKCDYILGLMEDNF